MARNQYVILRQGTAAQWTSVNSVLARGELGFETNTNKYKLGVDSNVTWNSLSYSGLSGFQNLQIPANFGNGIDGNASISSGTVTLTRDMYYNNLTFTGGQLITNGHRIFVSGILDVSSASAVAGSIKWNGNTGTTSSGTAGGAGGTILTAASIGGANSGGAGAGNSGANGAPGTASSTLALGDGGLGGTSGAGGIGFNGGSTGGTTTDSGSITSTFPIRRYETELLKGITLISGGQGGAGGASGGGGFSSLSGGGGGGGGSGGGVVAIYANIINRGPNTPANVIEAIGGIGGNGNNHAVVATSYSLGGGGGGAGGGGGWILIQYGSLTGSTATNAVNASGGVGGNGGNALQSINWTTRTSTNNGTSWNTDDSFLYSGGGISNGIGFISDSVGNLYAGGYAYDASVTQRWIVRKSADNGSTWSTVDDFLYPGGTSSNVSGMGVDHAQNIYAAGASVDGGGNNHWIVRQSTNSGVSWSTIDDFQYPGGTSTIATRTTTDLFGNVYVIGNATDSSSSQHWVVRQSTNNGVSWNTIDDYLYFSGVFQAATFIGVDLLGYVYYGGFGSNPGAGNNHWLVRQSQNQGVSWAIIDDFQLAGGTNSAPQTFTADLLGNIYVAGFGIDGTGIQHWITRQSSNSGVTWATVDLYQYTSLKTSHASGSITDSSGNVYVSGFGVDAASTQHWLIKQSSNQGVSWTVVDDFVYVNGTFSAAASMGKNSLGQIYATGLGQGAVSVNNTGGNGGNGGSGGSIALLQITNNNGSSISGTIGSPGGTSSDGNGGVGGNGGLAVMNL